MIKNHIWIGIAILMLGIIARLNAEEFAWPKNVGYSGPRSETSWARKEDAYGQVGIVLMCVGGALLVVSYAHWVFWIGARK